MSLTELIASGLAVWQIVEIWHHGALFETRRAAVLHYYTEHHNLRGWFCELLLCPFCLSPWVGAIVAGLLLLCGWKSPAGWLVMTFAAARIANLGNDLTHAFCRTPHRGDAEQEH